MKINLNRAANDRFKRALTIIVETIGLKVGQELRITLDPPYGVKVVIDG